jgi:hypothetical protein
MLILLKVISAAVTIEFLKATSPEIRRIGYNSKWPEKTMFFILEFLTNLLELYLFKGYFQTNVV